MNSKASDHAVFLDRDGTLMEDSSYVGDVERVVMIAGAGPALRRLQDAGFRLFVVTNQSGVGRGYFPREAVERIHAHLDGEFAKQGVRLTRYYVCPHHPEDKCECRKPKPKFLKDAAREFGLKLSKCYMIGDRPSDLQAGVNAGARAVLVLTGVGRETLAQGATADHVADDIGAAVDWILAQPL